MMTSAAMRIYRDILVKMYDYVVARAEWPATIVLY